MPGAGATFTVLFPASGRPARPLSGVIPAPVRRPTAGRTVLLADPHPGVRAVAAAALIGAGYEVVTAADATGARAVLRSAPDLFQAAVLEAEPVDASRLLAEATGERRIALVVTPSTTREADPDAFTPVPRCVTLAKPYRPDELLAAVARAVGE